MKKSFGIYSIGWLAVLGLFNVITFVTPNEIDGQSKFDNLFWVAYALISVFFLAQLICAYFTFKTDSLQKTFYNIPLFNISLIALVTMLIAGGVCMAVIAIPTWVGIIICCVVLTLNIVAYAVTASAVSAIAAVDKKIKTKTMFIKMLTADAQVLLAKAEGNGMGPAVNKVYEAIRYSDPMSDNALAAVEDKIYDKFSELSRAVDEGNAAAVTECSSQLLTLITERNTKCKFLK